MVVTQTNDACKLKIIYIDFVFDAKGDPMSKWWSVSL